MILPIVVGSPTVMWNVGGKAACSRGILNCRETAGGCVRESVNREVSAKSDFISANVVGGCLNGRAEGESSFAGGGGGATISGALSPRGPRGSESKSKSSNLETTD